MTELVAAGITLDRRLAGVDFTLAPGELVAIVGPNGSGKTSLLRVLAGLCATDDGSVRIGDAPLTAMSPRERARHIAYLPQRAEVAWPISVADMVALGRFAFGGALAAENREAVMRCLDEVGAAHLADRSTATLSGGEIALCGLARVLVANTPLLLLDEPTAALDPARQLAVMQRLRERTRQSAGIAVVLHDLNLAAKFADHIIWMTDGRVARISGNDPATVVALMREIFEVEGAAAYDDAGGLRGVAVAGPGQWGQ